MYFLLLLAQNLLTELQVCPHPQPHWVGVFWEQNPGGLAVSQVKTLLLPTNTWACLTPLSTAGVSEKTASVATASCLLGMLSAGFLDLSPFSWGKYWERRLPIG